MTPQGLQQALAELDTLGLRRHRHVLDGQQGAHITLDGRDILSFASNNYLGLAAHPAIAEAARAAIAANGLGAGAAHLLGGHHQMHEHAEQALARFVGMPAALLFSTGYMANMGVIPALVDRHGEVFADRLNHASLIDAALLSRAKLTRYPHRDLTHLKGQLAESSAKTKLIVSDTVFSMDGGLAPVTELLALAERYDAWLYLDDAHGFGVLGDEGRGVLSHLPLAARHSRLIYLATLGKAAGVAGAFVAGSSDLIEWLINKARTYVFTTAQPPALAAGVLQSLELITSEPWRRQHLSELINQLKSGVADLPWQLMPSDTPIQPLLMRDNHAALRVAEGLLERGIWAPAIRPPTVPAGSARLRISLSAAHMASDIDQLIAALQELAHD